MQPLLGPEHQELEEGLLRAGRDVSMSPGVREKTLAALGVGAAGAAAVTATKTGSLSWLTTKAGVVGSLGALAATGVVAAVALSGGFSAESSAIQQSQSKAPKTMYQPFSPPRERSAEQEPSQVEASQQGPLQHAPSEHKARSQRAEGSAPAEARQPASDLVGQSTPPSNATTKGEPSSLGASSLRQELSHIARVEAALKQKSPAGALSLLSEYRSRFSQPKLGLEAEVLTIQALYESGSVSAAQTRAQRFLERHPESPLGARAKQYAK